MNTKEFKINEIPVFKDERLKTGYAPFYGELLPELHNLVQSELQALICISYFHKFKKNTYTISKLAKILNIKYDTLLNGFKKLEDKGIITFKDGNLIYNKYDMVIKNKSKLDNIYQSLNNTKIYMIKDNIEKIENSIKDKTELIEFRKLKNKDYSDLIKQIEELQKELEDNRIELDNLQSKRKEKKESKSNKELEEQFNKLQNFNNKEQSLNNDNNHTAEIVDSSKDKSNDDNMGAIELTSDLDTLIQSNNQSKNDLNNKSIDNTNNQKKSIKSPENNQKKENDFEKIYNSNKNFREICDYGNFKDVNIQQFSNEDIVDIALNRTKYEKKYPLNTIILCKYIAQYSTQVPYCKLNQILGDRLKLDAYKHLRDEFYS